MESNFIHLLNSIINNLDSNFRIKGQQDIELIIESGVNSYDDLLNMLSRNIGIELKTIACWLLGRLGEKRAIPTLVCLLKHQNHQLRNAATIALGELDAKESLESLITTLINENNEEVAEAIVYTLGLLGDKAAFDILVNILQNTNKNPKIRGLAAEALADIRDQRAVMPLIEVLKDTSVEVRFWAIFSLGELGNEQALSELQTLALTDKSVLSDWGSIKEESLTAIHRIKEQCDRPIL
jgi:HEAT repeat protein